MNQHYDQTHIKHISPEPRDYKDYWDQIIAFNRAVQQKISDRLEEILGFNLGGFCISTTGSDGRLEKGPVSLVEICIYCDLCPGILPVTKHVSKALKENGLSTLFEDQLEVKCVNSDPAYIFALRKNDGATIDLISPNRVLDARFLYGDEEIFQNVKSKLAQELTSDQGTMIHERIKDKVREHFKVTLSGKQKFHQEILTHFDLDSGLAYFDNVKTWSFKQGPIRAVQYALVRDLVKGIRQGGNNEYLLHLPGNTIEKLNLLDVEHMATASAPEIRDLADCYKFFIWLYHKSQDAYCRDQTTETAFNAKEVKERCNAVAMLCRNQIYDGSRIHS